MPSLSVNLLQTPTVGVPWWKPAILALMLALIAFAAWEGFRDRRATNALVQLTAEPSRQQLTPKKRQYSQEEQSRLNAAITLIEQIERPWIARLAAIQDNHRRGIHLTALEFTESGDRALINGRAVSFILLLNYQNKLSAHRAVEKVNLITHSPFTAPAGSGYSAKAPSIEFSLEIQWKTAT